MLAGLRPFGPGHSDAISCPRRRAFGYLERSEGSIQKKPQREASLPYRLAPTFTRHPFGGFAHAIHCQKGGTLKPTTQKGGSLKRSLGMANPTTQKGGSLKRSLGMVPLASCPPSVWRTCGRGPVFARLRRSVLVPPPVKHLPQYLAAGFTRGSPLLPPRRRPSPCPNPVIPHLMRNPFPPPAARSTLPFSHWAAAISNR